MQQQPCTYTSISCVMIYNGATAVCMLMYLEEEAIGRGSVEVRVTEKGLINWSRMARHYY